MRTHLLAGEGRGHHPDLSPPLLLGGAVDGRDQQRQRVLWGALQAPGSVNGSVSLYPEVRRVVALQPHRTPPPAVQEPDWRRQKHTFVGKEEGKQSWGGWVWKTRQVETTTVPGPPSCSYIIHFKLGPKR